MFIIPAIDILEGKCVRLTQGDYAQKKIYNEDPLEVAKQFEDAGIQRLHLVDLDGARAKHIVNYSVLERIASKTTLWIDFGGGLKSNQDLRIAFESGAKQITGGTIAVKEPTTFLNWLEAYGSDKIILGADADNRKVAVSGWQEKSELGVIDFIQDYHNKGIHYAICTDIAKDGMLQGASLALYRDIKSAIPALALIASGGVSSIEDILHLEKLGCFGAIVGKAIYENKISLAEVQQYHLQRL